MKMNKKKLAVVSLVLCVIAILSMGSLAWFTADDSIKNTLNFADSSDFVIDVIEHDADGQEVGTLSDPIGNTYDDLFPNQLIAKDPYVINKSASEDQFIRVTVTLSNAAKWASLVTEGTDLTTIFEGFDESKWTRYDDPTVDAANDKISYTFYLNDKLEALKNVAVFSGVRVPSTVTLDDVADLQATIISIKAEAKQTTGFSDSATAYTAFNSADTVKEVTASN